jgi:ATP-dependent HslUV protease ATP-binding subunit HslU
MRIECVRDRVTVWVNGDLVNDGTGATATQGQIALQAEGVEVEFTEAAVAELARLAEEVNARTENIGARRLHTIMERLLEEILFAAPDAPEKRLVVDPSYVEARLKGIIGNEDLSRYIL